MDILTNLIAKLSAAATDPIVKLLLIGFIALIFFVIVYLGYQLLFQIFSSIFRGIRRLFKKRSPKDSEVPNAISESNDDSVSELETLSYGFEEYLKIGNETLENLKQCISEVSNSSDGNVVFPQPIKLDQIKGEIKPLETLDYKVTEKDAQKIVDDCSNMNTSELEIVLSEIKNIIKVTEITVENDKTKYLKAIDQQPKMYSTEQTSVEKYNKEILKVFKKQEELNCQKENDIKGLKQAEDTLYKQINSLVSIIEHISKQEDLLKTRINEANETIKHIRENVHNSYYLSNDSLINLDLFKENAESAVIACKQNYDEINRLAGSIEDNNQKLALNQLKEKVVCTQIEKLKLAEAKLLADKKAKEEAEAKEKARLEAEAKEKARLEEEAKEKARLEALQKEEDVRKAAEKAELLRKQEELKLMEEELKKQEEKNNANTKELTPEEEAAEAKAMLEAQRLRRRGEVVAPIVVSEPSEDLIDKEEDAKSAPENKVVPETGIKEAEITEPENDIKQKRKQPDVDPDVIMSELRAEWAKEREARERFAAEKEAREAEIAQRRAKLKAESNDNAKK